MWKWVNISKNRSPKTTFDLQFDGQLGNRSSSEIDSWGYINFIKNVRSNSKNPASFNRSQVIPSFVWPASVKFLIKSFLMISTWIRGRERAVTNHFLDTVTGMCMIHLCSAKCKSLILPHSCMEKGIISNKYPKDVNSKKGIFYCSRACSCWKIRKKYYKFGNKYNSEKRELVL